MPNQLTNGPRVTSAFSRPLCAIGLAATGCAVAFFVLLIGFPFLISFLDSAWCPPLEAQGNFGQFGFFLIAIAPMLLVSGFSYVLIPFMRWWKWGICFVIIYGFWYLVLVPFEVFSQNLLHVTNVALFISGMILCLFGLACRFTYSFFEQKEKQVS